MQFFLVKILELDTPRALGLLISVTPPTVAASVTTFMIEGDVPLSITASVTTSSIKFYMHATSFHRTGIHN